MKSRKGEYYIACYNHGEMYLRKKTGYILDDWGNQYGMCRGEDGLYRITDLETGALLCIPGPINYSVAHTYIQLQRTVKKSGDCWTRGEEDRNLERRRGKYERRARQTNAVTR